MIMADTSTRLSFEFRCTKVDATPFLFALDCLSHLSVAETAPDGLIPVPPELRSFCPPVGETSHLPIAYRHWASLLDIFDDPEDLDLGITAHYDKTEGRLWICDEAGRPNIDALAALIQRLLPCWLPIGFEWSHDCAKPRTDAFGGGWCLITEDQIMCETTADQLNRAWRAVIDAEQISSCASVASDRVGSDYRVSWLIDVDAPSPLEAADEAFAAMRDPVTTATVFEVTDSTGARFTVDVDARSEEPCEPMVLS
jgi:hypothetical protein